MTDQAKNLRITFVMSRGEWERCGTDRPTMDDLILEAASTRGTPREVVGLSTVFHGTANFGTEEEPLLLDLDEHDLVQISADVLVIPAEGEM